MGLSSSQARLLNMTSRMHQIEYKAAKLEAQKLQMANESSRVYEEYLDALEATKVQIKKIDSDGSISYDDIRSYGDFTGAGFYLKIGDTVYSENTGANGWSGITEALGITSPDMSNFPKLFTNIINSGQVVIVEKRVENSNTYYDDTSIATNTSLQEIPDESQLRKAEAQYEADMRKIDAKDRKYDADLAALDTERNAVKSEMDTLKTVARDNVERTFKLFS